MYKVSSCCFVFLFERGDNLCASGLKGLIGLIFFLLFSSIHFVLNLNVVFFWNLDMSRCTAAKGNVKFVWFWNHLYISIVFFVTPFFIFITVATDGKYIWLGTGHIHYRNIPKKSTYLLIIRLNSWMFTDNLPPLVIDHTLLTLIVCIYVDCVSNTFHFYEMILCI